MALYGRGKADGSREQAREAACEQYWTGSLNSLGDVWDAGAAWQQEHDQQPDAGEDIA